MQPISIKREEQYGGPSSSNNLNRWISENYEDLSSIFGLMDSYGKQIPENTKMLIIENIMLQKKVNELAAQIDNIEKALVTSENKVLLRSFAESFAVGETAYLELEQDTDYGVLRIPKVQEISKLYLVDLNGKNFVPESLRTNVYESTLPIDITGGTIELQNIETEGISNIFDGDRTTFWLNKSTKDTSTTDVYFCIEIFLPTNIVNHTRANILTIDPTPLASLQILDIQYIQSQGVTNWERLPSFPTHNDGGDIEPTTIDEVGRIKFCFPTKSVEGVRIYCKQPNWFLENGMRNFYYGFRNIDVNYVSFKTEEARTRVVFNIPDDTKQFTSVISATPVFADGSITDQDSVSVYKVCTPNGQEFNFGDTLPAATQSVQIEIGLHLSTEISPLLSGLYIDYESA